MELTEYHYVYYSYEEYGRGYIGSRTCKCLPEEDVKYFGSFRDKTFKPTQKIILKTYATREEAYSGEIILHDYYDVTNNPHFANKAKQTSTKFCSISAGKEGGKRTYHLGLGIHSLSLGEKREYGRIGALKTLEMGIGIHSLTKEQRRNMQMGSKNSFYGKTHTDEVKNKMSEDRIGEKNAFYGKSHNEETKQKIGEKNREKMKGKLWWNNGQVQQRCIECPGDEWVRGRIKK